MRLLLSHPSSADANAARSADVSAARSADVSAARASDRKADVARTRRQSRRAIDLAVPTELSLRRPTAMTDTPRCRSSAPDVARLACLALTLSTRPSTRLREPRAAVRLLRGTLRNRRNATRPQAGQERCVDKGWGCRALGFHLRLW